jgi:hypothetical protein
MTDRFSNHYCSCRSGKRVLFVDHQCGDLSWLAEILQERGLVQLLR